MFRREQSEATEANHAPRAAVENDKGVGVVGHETHGLKRHVVVLGNDLSLAVQLHQRRRMGLWVCVYFFI